MPLDWSPLWLSLRYAGGATLLAAAVAVPLARLLAHRRFPGCDWLDALASLPFVLPPAVLAYYLLSSLGRWPLRFSWHAALLLSAVYTLPLLFRNSRAALAAVDPGFENAARVLGAGEWRIFIRITLPLARPALAAALLAGFLRAFVDFAAAAILAGRTAAWLLLPAAASALVVFYWAAFLQARPRQVPS